MPPRSHFRHRIPLQAIRARLTPSRARRRAMAKSRCSINCMRDRRLAGPDHVIYTGDGSSDVHVMLHINMRDGFTIAVSEAKHVSQVAKRTVLSTNALAVLAPILEEIVGWDRYRIRGFFDSHGLLIQEWDRVRTDWLTVRPAGEFDAGGRIQRRIPAGGRELTYPCCATRLDSAFSPAPARAGVVRTDRSRLAHRGFRSCRVASGDRATLPNRDHFHFVAEEKIVFPAARQFRAVAFGSSR